MNKYRIQNHENGFSIKVDKLSFLNLLLKNTLKYYLLVLVISLIFGFLYKFNSYFTVILIVFPGITVISILEMFYFHRNFIYSIQVIEDQISIEFTNIKIEKKIQCKIKDITFKSENYAKGSYRLLIIYKEAGKKIELFQMENGYWDKYLIKLTEQILNEYKLKVSHLAI